MEEIIVIVPFDKRNGDVYLNSIGATQEEALRPFVTGCFEITSDEIEFIDVVEATLIMTNGDVPENLFPVVVPVSKDTGRPTICGIGCNSEEVVANLNFNECREDDHFFEAGMLVMPGSTYLPALPRC